MMQNGKIRSADILGVSNEQATEAAKERLESIAQEERQRSEYHARYNTQAQHMGKKIREMEQQMSALNRQLGTVSSKIRRLSAELEELQGQEEEVVETTEQDGRIQDFEENLANSEAELERYKAQEVTAQVEALRAEKDQVERDNPQAQVERVMHDIARCQAKRHKVAQEIESLKRQAQMAQSNLEELREDFTKATERYQRMLEETKQVTGMEEPPPDKRPLKAVDKESKRFADVDIQKVIILKDGHLPPITLCCQIRMDRQVAEERYNATKSARKRLTTFYKKLSEMVKKRRKLIRELTKQ
ncbi:unnamed protein product, partial [Symbiodinium sp. KB8]